ncbi:glycerophosphodiester phosphodiesterase [Lacinutrix salivirga]
MPLKIGHRGAKGYLPENTIPSFKKALEYNVDGIELDVHLCASGELVVFHDFTIDRLTNGSGEVSEFTLQQLKALYVEENFKIPTLVEVLDVIDKKCLVNIELKGKNTALACCKIIEDYISNGWRYSNFIVSSFQHQELEKVFKANKNIALAVLTKANLDEAITFAETIKAKAIHPNFSLLSKRNVQATQAKGYLVNTWTVNTEQAIARMKTYEVDGIISDFPDRL